MELEKSPSSGHLTYQAGKIKTDTKQCVSEEIYSEYRAKQDVKEGDILLVRDGTYLIGSLAMVTQDDLPMLYQSHVVRIRVQEGSPVSPNLLLVSLSSQVVQEQMQARRFTSDIIDTLGTRYLDVVLPLPKSHEARQQVESQVQEVIAERARLRARITEIATLVE